jgi:hypothetical protein
MCTVPEKRKMQRRAQITRLGDDLDNNVNAIVAR